MRSSFTIAILLLLSLAGPVAAGDAAPKLVVFPLENRGSPLSAEELSQLTDYLASKLGEGGQYRIINRADLAAVLAGKACVERDCQLEAGMQLGAAYTVSVSLGRLGDLCILSASMYRAGESAALRTATERGGCQAPKLLDAVDVTAVKLKARALGAGVAVAPPPDLPVKTPSQAPAVRKPVERPDVRPMPLGPDGRPAPAAPAPEIEARPMAVGPDGIPLPNQPVPEAQPRSMPPPVVLPPGWPKAPAGQVAQAASQPESPSGEPGDSPQGDPGDREWADTDPARASAPQAPQAPRRFLSLSMNLAYPHLQHSGPTDYSEPKALVGSRLAFDWLMGEHLIMGVGFVGQAGSGDALAEVNLRFGGIFRLGEDLVLTAFGAAGLGGFLPDDESSLVGFSLALGTGLRYMISPHFGLLAEIGGSVQIMDGGGTNDGYDTQTNELNLWRLQLDTGVVVGW